ncbi:DMT family transporter [Rhizobium sp. BK251]|uniref:DMT family transporter n=1 Tax=Rhizobium sp. BK251 TaxID=2512125 RepID=UPI0010438ADD|nr:DMT family transporter [Rhizobium sp. BK251]TCL69661.1 threonine/homoserine efflux transporter RhtA [Rhizobium sp. BK251]
MTRANAHLALLLAAALWGFGNIAQKTVLEHMGPLTATWLRCAIAALAMLPFAALETKLPQNSGWHRSTIAVVASFAAAITLQQAAYLSTSVTNASFLVNTATVMTPIVAWLVLREATGRLGFAAAFLTLAGVLLMSNAVQGLDELNKGDLLCLVSALFYALWMVALGRHAQLYPSPFQTAYLQFAFAALVAFPPALALEEMVLPSIAAAAPELVALGLFATAAAFTLQTIAQRYTTASRAAILVSGESIFGAIGAYAVLHERPPVVVVTGAALIFVAILMVSLQPGRASVGSTAPAPDT